MSVSLRLLQGIGLSGVLVLGTAAATRAQERAPVTPSVDRELGVVRAAMNSAEMQEALKYVDTAHDETVREFLQVCNAAGPSQDEIYRARLLRKLLLIYGLEDVIIDDWLNVYGIRRGAGGGPAVVLNAHYDNIHREPKEQPVEAFVADGRIWCNAADDDLIGTVQALTVLRALNAGNIRTKGDVWFAFFTGEEPLKKEASPGAGFFVDSNYPLNLDWKNGDVLMQFHGGGGQGVSTGGTDMRHRPQLRVFVPLDRSEWGPWSAVDVLGKIITRITAEVRDTREAALSGADVGSSDVLQMNPSQIQSSESLNGVAYEASLRFDMHTSSEARLWQAHRQIMQIAKEVCADFGAGCTYLYTVNNKNGREEGIPGWDMMNNAPARYAAAAAQVLYGKPGVIGWGGCGDCVRAIRNGMPAMSFRGNVVDRSGGNVAIGGGRTRLQSPVRRMSGHHTETASVPIDNIWAAVKHGLLFTVSYVGSARQ